MIIPKKNLLLIFILLIASFMRFYMLGSNPPSLNWDETAWGYNAYSLGIDGRDEFGRFLPLDYLESFGDFKPPVYAYLDVFPIKIFGLNEFAVRFPSALFGVLTVLIVYFLVKKIFYKSPLKEAYAFFSCLLMAISPWHIMLSRAAFEANAATFFVILGVLLFLVGIREKRWVLLLSVASFVASIYTFNTARIVSPLLVVILGLIFRKELLARKKETILAFITGVILILPVVGFLFSPQASLRFKEVNIFSDVGVIESSNKQIENDNNSIISKVIHNRRFMFAVSYVRHYIDHFNPNFLFISGDGNPKFSTQTVGQLYLWELPFLVFGMLVLIKKKEGYWWLLPIILFVGIIPAGVARETPHALRIENSMPAFHILTAYGFVTFINALKKYKKAFLAIAVLLLCINVIYFLHDYLTHYKRIYSKEWQYGYKDSIKYVQSVYEDYDLFYITDVLGRPYIYYMFYTAENPKEFRKKAQIKRDTFGFVNIESYDKFVFSNKKTSQFGKRILRIDVPGSVPESANIIKVFYLPNGEKSLVAYVL